MKSGRIGRIIHLLTALQSGQSYRVNDLVEILNVSRRMIFRDLCELRQIGVPCNFDNKARCYKIAPQFFLSAPNLDTQEALGLLLLAHKARNHIHFPFRDSALKAALKIENDLPEKTKRFCSIALEKISIKANPQERLELLDRKFAQLLEAILNKRIVTVSYRHPVRQESRIIKLCPYHLMYNRDAWYVFGREHQETSRKMGVFKLNYINELNILDKCFVEEDKFDLYEHIGRAWSMEPGGRLYNIKLRFSPEIARGVADVQWHSTQAVAYQKDGSAIIEFRIDGLNEITWWILSYGDKVQVLAPADLRQRVIEIAQNVVKQNT